MLTGKSSVCCDEAVRCEQSTEPEQGGVTSFASIAVQIEGERPHVMRFVGCEIGLAVVEALDYFVGERLVTYPETATTA